MSSANSIRLGVLTSHPIQYQAPLFRQLAGYKEIDLTVYFCSRRGVRDMEDPGFGTEIVWDVPLLEGYDYEFLLNWSPFSDQRLLVGNVNPGIIQRIRHEDIVLIHSYDDVTSWLAFAAAQLSDTGVVFRSESNHLNPPSSYLRPLRNAGLKLLFESIDAFASIGTYNKQFYQSYGIAEERIFHAPYSVNNEYFRQQAKQLPEVEALRRQEGLPTDIPIILFVGKLVTRKRPGLLLDAFTRVTEPGKAVLLFVGDGYRRDALERRATATGRDNDIVFAGFKNQSQLPRYYGMSDIFVLPSVNENWGLVINEAMNFGLPVIASDAVGAVADLVNKKNGLVVPADDLKPLANALKTMLTEEDLNRMGERSREYINDWDVPTTADGIIRAALYVAGGK